ncbi:hypothetical protein M0805_003210 [Coniferiporia weirii]|nr:hypothetical protein M0805_003210 [Coniferiporia weirii]
MILENKLASDDEKLVDAPPSYDEANSSHPRPLFQTGSSTEKSSSRPRFPSTSGADLDSAPVASSSRLSTSSPTHASFSKSRAQHVPSAPAAKPSPKSQADVRTTVLGLVRDVVQKGTATVGADAARGILESCASACTAHGVPLGRVLQERSVEGHTPIYWAVVNRRRGPSGTTSANMNAGGNGAEREDKDILFALLAHAGPLSPASVADLRLACLVTADNVLYQRLRTSPAMNSLSGTDRMLLSGWQDNAGSETGLAEASNRPKGRRFFADIADVLEGDSADAGAFSVRLEIAMFQRRMRVSNEVTIEFIARGRLWDLCFFVVPSSPSHVASTASSSSSSSSASSSGRHEASSQRRSSVPKAALAAVRGRGIAPGAWVACLSLLAHSPPCSADAQLVIPVPELKRTPTPPAGIPPPLPPRRPSTPTLISFDHDRPPSHPRSSPSLFNLAQRSKPATGPGGLKPPISLRLTSPFGHTGALVAPLPPPADEVAYTFEVPGAGSAKAKRKTRKREARAAARAQREHEGKEKQAVLIARLEEQIAGRGEDKGGCLMYDGCSYIAPDGTLRAVLETRIRGTDARARSDTDCIIC